MARIKMCSVVPVLSSAVSRRGCSRGVEEYRRIVVAASWSKREASGRRRGRPRDGIRWHAARAEGCSSGRMVLLLLPCENRKHATEATDDELDEVEVEVWLCPWLFPARAVPLIGREIGKKLRGRGCRTTDVEGRHER